MPISAWAILLLVLVLAPILLIRFRKRWVAAFNLAVTNRITSRFAARLRGFGILTHVGRKSGRAYRTPVNVFRAPGGFLIALTYGRESEWVKNVIAAGGCELETQAVQHRLSAPTVVHDPARRRFPLFVRIVLRLIGANDFMQLSISPAQGSCVLISGHAVLSLIVVAVRAIALSARRESNHDALPTTLHSNSTGTRRSPALLVIDLRA
jgi:deazaflavin-dependent oxidoreductase (nitroreductase family)